MQDCVLYQRACFLLALDESTSFLSFRGANPCWLPEGRDLIIPLLLDALRSWAVLLAHCWPFKSIACLSFVNVWCASLFFLGRSFLFCAPIDLKHHGSLSSQKCCHVVIFTRNSWSSTFAKCECNFDVHMLYLSCRVAFAIVFLGVRHCGWVSLY